ncbi:MAG: GNAT family N-acetyltransferase [Pseudomonadota bacterium]
MTKPAYHIRKATIDDVGQIEEITNAAYSKWIARIGRKPLPMTADYPTAISNHRVDLIEQDDKVIGLIETVPTDLFLHIESVAVSPNHQRKGIGRRLLDHAEQVAQASGLSELRLYTNEQFEGNVALYQKCGYRIRGREAIEGGVRVDMVKCIERRR